ncbi:MAG: nucleotidyltransferase domain-containing protein [Spartobacteria bacterium]|nr:nucleotidyltransferase domain-containing protein [Spartobacteria bacterium]
MTSSQIQNAVSAVLPKIVAQVAPLKVFLFGSAIHQKPAAVHDLDFLVVVPDRTRPAAVADRLNVGVRDKPMPCDFLVATPSLLAKHRHRRDSVYAAALAEGRQIYAR